MSEAIVSISESAQEIKRRKKRENSQKWRKENPERLKLLKQRYYQKHKESIWKKNQEWRAKNTEHLRAYRKSHPQKITEGVMQYRRTWWKENKEKQNIKGRERYHKNKQAVKLRRAPYQAEYKAKNKAKMAENNKRYYASDRGKAFNKNKRDFRRAAKNGCENKATTDQIKDFLKAAVCCAYCFREFSSKLKATLDHIIPLKKKGAHALENFAAACLSCNSSKHDKTVEEFRAYKCRVDPML